MTHRTGQARVIHSSRNVADTALMDSAVELHCLFPEFRKTMLDAVVVLRIVPKETTFAGEIV